MTGDALPADHHYGNRDGFGLRTPSGPAELQWVLLHDRLGFPLLPGPWMSTTLLVPVLSHFFLPTILLIFYPVSHLFHFFPFHY